VTWFVIVWDWGYTIEMNGKIMRFISRLGL
jgi:hypothetical protein